MVATALPEVWVEEAAHAQTVGFFAVGLRVSVPRAALREKLHNRARDLVRQLYLFQEPA